MYIQRTCESPGYQSYGDRHVRHVSVTLICLDLISHWALLMPRRPTSPDPLSIVIRPPIDETPHERAARTQAEAEALRISAEIDAELDVSNLLPVLCLLWHLILWAQIERENLKKRKAKREVKVVLLGQAESGAVCY